MKIDQVLGRLDGVKQSSPTQWIAKCPAHQDRAPSLSVSVGAEDGRVLLHCFAGCDAPDVIAALGLSVSDLFEQPLYHRAKSVQPRLRFSAIDALRCLSRESAVIAIAAADIVEGKPLSPEDADRVARAAGLIAEALEVVNG